MRFSIFGLLVLGVTTLAAPNFVFIISDDQDVHLNSLAHMPLLKTYMTEQGTNFSKHYCTVAQCCPSRVTLWTGKAAHNTNVTDVQGPFGMYVFLVRQVHN
jgi:N-acetylglucosamine-6-sulfatase